MSTAFSRRKAALRSGVQTSTGRVTAGRMTTPSGPSSTRTDEPSSMPNFFRSLAGMTTVPRFPTLAGSPMSLPDYQTFGQGAQPESLLAGAEGAGYPAPHARSQTRGRFPALQLGRSRARRALRPRLDVQPHVLEAAGARVPRPLHGDHRRPARARRVVAPADGIHGRRHGGRPRAPRARTC